ncbi:MAG: LysM peptidoglycan-binding domain-containing protein [Desulfatibacillaceae bacterium]|nr:LysM peptidoglycan-binding domain-containing protein [Desulfatibacillaceae bacterium]
MDSQDRRPDFAAGQTDESQAQEAWEGEQAYMDDPGQKTMMLWIGGGLLALVIVVAFFVFGKGGNEAVPADISGVTARIESLEARLAQIETRMSVLAQMDERLARLTRQGETLTDQARILAANLDKTAQTVDALSKRVDSTASRVPSPAPAPTAAPAPAPSAPAPTAAPAPAAPSPAGERPFHEVKAGETLYRISVQHKVSVDELKRINKLKSDTISIGQKIYLK